LLKKNRVPALFVSGELLGFTGASSLYLGNKLQGKTGMGKHSIYEDF
jgi:hypothetical protein